jgi:hypothetical protein
MPSLFMPPSGSAPIDRIASPLRSSIRKIETVPPSDAAYIDREHSQALEQRNRARFDIVFAHPFYRAHEDHKHFNVVWENLEAARAARTVADQVIYLSVVLSRFSDLGAALSEYYAFDLRRGPNRVLGGEGVTELSFQFTIAKHRILELMQCGVRQIGLS